MGERIATTHVGSLPRPAAMVEMIYARERGEQVDAAEFDACAASTADDLVARQRAAGIDYASDGECAKLSYATYVKERYDGFAGDSPRKPPADLLQFPDYLEQLARSGGTPTYTRPCCVAPIRLRDAEPLRRDIANLTAAVGRHGGTGFMNAVSPGTVALFQPNSHYESDEAYWEATAEALRSEYEEITAAGLILQVDCPDFALARHMIFNDLSDDEFAKLAMRQAEILNHALRNVPADRSRIHVCWGNYEGPHLCDIGMDKIFDALMALKPQALLFESCNPRHAHEWQVFADRASDIPDDKVLVPGVIDSLTNFVEHPQLVAERLRRFIAIVGRERVMAGSDCGFGTFAGYGKVAPGIVWAKFAAMAEGAELACKP